jgi:hypothetical protein
MWEIPTWGHPLALGVYPLFITRNRHLIPVGTTFCMSKLGVSLTALHNVCESVRRYWENDVQCQMDNRSARYTIKDFGMALFHHQVLPGGKLSGNLWRFGFIDGTPPLDICYILSQFQGTFSYLPLPLSFAVPQIGSRVVCAGFSNSAVSDSGFSLDDMQSGRINLLDAYEHKFFAIEGRVNRIFTQRFKNGFIGGPSYTIDTEIGHGMIGGPVFSESRYVCGIISAGATNFFGEPASIISSLYPALGMNIRFCGQSGRPIGALHPYLGPEIAVERDRGGTKPKAFARGFLGLGWQDRWHPQATSVQAAKLITALRVQRRNGPLTKGGKSYSDSGGIEASEQSGASGV